MSEFKYIGKSAVRVDGKEKITGAAKYVDDLDFGPSLLYAAVVESPHAHAEINSIDTSEAAGQLYLVMEYIEGETLAKVLEKLRAAESDISRRRSLLRSLSRQLEKSSQIGTDRGARADLAAVADIELTASEARGDPGGEVVVAGTPEEVARVDGSWTGASLAATGCGPSSTRSAGTDITVRPTSASPCSGCRRGSCST